LIDVAPKGDPAGSWKVLDDKSIVIPDRPGNNRADIFQNIVDNPRAGLMFIIPERREAGSMELNNRPSYLRPGTDRAR